MLCNLEGCQNYGSSNQQCSSETNIVASKKVEPKRKKKGRIAAKISMEIEIRLQKTSR